MAKLSKHIYTPAKRAKKVAGRSSKGKKQHYSLAERRAFWIGVGISNAQHDNADLMLHADSAIRESVRAGYHADNIKDMSHKLKHRAKKPAAKKSTKKPAKRSNPYDDFEWGPNGIKGSYTIDGFFEPD